MDITEEMETDIMAGTITGGKKAAATNLANDPDFYRKIGRKGGKLGTTGGFAADRELAREAGAIGGRKSRRGPAKKVSNEAIKTSEV